MYWTLDMDHSIFDVVRGRVYAYSNSEAICRYDGKRISALMNDFREEAEKYEDIESPEQADSIYGQSWNEENRN